MGPSYACLFVGFVEEQIFSRFHGRIPDVFKGFIDDRIGLTSSSWSQLMDFFDFVSGFHPSLRFTCKVIIGVIPVM